jgi:hypothetical protein
MKLFMIFVFLITFASCNSDVNYFDFPGVITVKDHTDIVKLNTDSEITYFAYYYLESSKYSHNGA